jgi:3-phosphoglycerate kinase
MATCLPAGRRYALQLAACLPVGGDAYVVNWRKRAIFVYYRGMRTLEHAGDLRNKKIVLRVDFDVPVGEDGVIQEEYRVARQKEAIERLLAQDARVVMLAHIKAVPSFEPLMPQLQRILGLQVQFCKDLDEVESFWAHEGQLALLDNARRDEREEANDAGYAALLAKGADVYVNNAFAVCHRPHASVVALASLLPSYAGPLVVQETAQLNAFIDQPAEGKVIYMAGAKASTKVPVIKNLIGRAQAVAVGGVIANDIFKALGRDIDGSRFDENAVELLAGLDLRDTKLHIPSDQIIEKGQYFDIGPQTAAKYADLAKTAKLIVWNGPMGVFEDDRFMGGTRVVAEAIAASAAAKVIGGGDTISAVNKLGLLDKMGFVSTGGGAMLVFLAGQDMPGLKALGYYD